MGASVLLGDDDLVVVPGTGFEREVRVRNTGSVVDRFELDILGDAAGWTKVEPATINLLPGEESTARILFAPPRTSNVSAGSVPFALRVMSREDTAGSVISEAAVTVSPFLSVSAELVPRTSRGSRVGRHQLAIDNLGNDGAEVRLIGSDPDRLLDFRITPDLFKATAGTATFIKVKVLPKKRFLKGKEKSLPFEVAVVVPGHEPVQVPGVMLQGPIVPPWLLKFLLLVAAIVGALLLLWGTVLKPQVESTAKEVAEKETVPIADAVKASQKTADEAATSAEEARVAAGLPPKKKGAAGAGAGAGGAGTAGAGTTAAAGPGENATATDFRITTSTLPGPVGVFQPFTYTPPKGKLAWISDIVLQNPRADIGLLQIRRGKTVLLEFGLENFRDLDYHLIQPLRFSHTAPVVIAIECHNPGTTACTPSVYFTGQRDDAPKPKAAAKKT
jgi:hypothetical protein